MPKFHGTSLLGLLAATLVFYIIGFVWYGILFDAMWMELSGITLEEATANNEKLGIMMYVWGLLISFAQVLGLNYLVNLGRASRLKACVKVCVKVAVLIALPILGYSALYGGAPVKLLAIDFGHMLIGYIAVGAVLAAFRGKDAIGEGDS